MIDNNIEYINALAPFDHGIWEGSVLTGGNVKVGADSLFSERSIWLVDKITKYLIDNFTRSALESMSVLEVGSYDGWVLTQICKKIKFSNVIGVEPRKKNIKKGEVGRLLANVNTQAKFIQGSASDIKMLFPDQQFDIVICLGMLHHVSSTYDTIASICDKSLNIIIIDSMIIPELQSEYSDIEPYVNTKDIVYYGEEKTWAIAAFKFESPYGDGSRPDFGIVNIPSAQLIEMSLSSCGFSKHMLLGSEFDFYNNTKQNLRGVKEILLVGQREMAQNNIDNKWIEKIQKSENIFCPVTLPDALILAMVKIFPDFKELSIQKEVESATSIEHNANVDELVHIFIFNGVDAQLKSNIIANVEGINENHFDIINVIFRSPYEKIIFEISKFFIAKQLPLLAIKYLQFIVSKPGCDWWAFYRSCYILRKSFQIIGDKEKTQHYQDLLLLSNENFPY